MKIAVIGGGGVGGICATGLVRGGLDVTVVTGNPKITHAIDANGLRAKIDGAAFQTPMKAVTEVSAQDGPFGLVLLATPPNALAAAATKILPFCTPDAPFVSFQNGLAEEHLQAAVGPERTVGGIVSFGASMHAPGEVEKTSDGGYTIGRLDGRLDPVLDTVARVLEKSAPVERTTNLRGARWSKLAINCAISSLGTIGKNRLGALMRHRVVRRLCLETMTEVTQVALAEGVRLEKVSGTLDLEWFALDDDERMVAGSPSLVAKHTVLLAVGAKYRRLRSSMLGAIERGREPPVAFLNGEITSRAKKHGIPAPVNQALIDMVWAISRGEQEGGMPAIHRVFDETRVTLRGLKLAA